jgi:hypothetical protein
VGRFILRLFVRLAALVLFVAAGLTVTAPAQVADAVGQANQAFTCFITLGLADSCHMDTSGTAAPGGGPFTATCPQPPAFVNADVSVNPRVYHFRQLCTSTSADGTAISGANIHLIDASFDCVISTASEIVDHHLTLTSQCTADPWTGGGTCPAIMNGGLPFPRTAGLIPAAKRAGLKPGPCPIAAAIAGVARGLAEPTPVITGPANNAQIAYGQAVVIQVTPDPSAKSSTVVLEITQPNGTKITRNMNPALASALPAKGFTLAAQDAIFAGTYQLRARWNDKNAQWTDSLAFVVKPKTSATSAGGALPPSSVGVPAQKTAAGASLYLLAHGCATASTGAGFFICPGPEGMNACSVYKQQGLVKGCASK